MAKKLPVDWNAFRAMVVGGLSIREVAKRLGVNPATALSRASRDGWHIGQLYTRGTKKMLAHTQQSVQLDKDAFHLADAKTKFHLAQAVAKASETLNSLPSKQLINKHQALASLAKTASSVFHWDSSHPHPFLSFQGVLFSLPPHQLASKDASFDQLLQQYGASHPVRDLDSQSSLQSPNQS
jgi:hypothetical protein